MRQADQRYAETLALIRSFEEVRSPEFIAQISLTVLAALTAWITLGLWLIPIWCLVHYGIVLTEKYVLVRFADAPSRAVFYGVVVLNALAAFSFIILPISLWYIEGDIYKFAAMALLTGATLNTVLIRSRVWQLMACYMFTNALAFSVIAIDFWKMEASLGETVSATVVAMCVLVYFLVAGYEANRLHRLHRMTSAALSRAHKLEAIGQFSEGIAHDFNNVLSVVIGNLELVEQPENPYDRKELANEALMAARRGAKLAAQLQALGRGKETAPVHVDVSHMLVEIRSMLQRVLPANIALSVVEDGFLPTAYVDETMLHASLLNLGLNARDAMIGGGKIEFEARRVSAQSLPSAPLIGAPFGPASFVRLSVKDGGHGMTPAEVQRVTEPFFSTKPEGRGTGLGLTMVAAFVQRHQGALAIDSVLGKGTQVSIYLPVHAQAALTLRRRITNHIPSRTRPV